MKRQEVIDMLILRATERAGYIHEVKDKDMFARAVALAERAGRDVRVRRVFWEGSYHWRYDIRGFVCIW